MIASELPTNNATNVTITSARSAEKMRRGSRTINAAIHERPQYTPAQIALVQSRRPVTTSRDPVILERVLTQRKYLAATKTYPTPEYTVEITATHTEIKSVHSIQAGAGGVCINTIKLATAATH